MFGQGRGRAAPRVKCSPRLGRYISVRGHPDLVKLLFIVRPSLVITKNSNFTINGKFTKMRNVIKHSKVAINGNFTKLGKFTLFRIKWLKTYLKRTNSI